MTIRDFVAHLRDLSPMTSVMNIVVLGLLWMVACAQPKISAGVLSDDVAGSAPTELTDIARFLYRTQSNADVSVPSAGLIALEEWIATFANDGLGITKDTSLNDRSWSLVPLKDVDVVDITRPDRPLSKLIASAVAYVSTSPLICHAAIQADPEQLPIEATAKSYVRTFIDQPDPHCFVDRSCTELKTTNDIVRSSILFEAEIILLKNYRWFDYEKDGERRHAFYSRGWAEKPSDSTDGPGGNQLWQNYSIDVFIDRGSDVLRFQTLWSESDLYLLGVAVDDGTQLATVSSSTDGIFRDTDKYIKKTFEPSGRCQ